MAEPLMKACRKASKTYEFKRASSSPKDQIQQSKRQRKGENPVRIPPSPDHCADFKSSNSWTCKNSACRATLSIDDTFCRRCSCCICHLFDDNKDPSLWLECVSDLGLGDSCGLSCHIECALQRGKVGVVDLGPLMQLDGSYCCASCGKVSGILGCWKKQLSIAKDARRVDILCYRIFLSFRLLDGTSRFNELHDIVRDAKSKIETEVGPVNGVSAKMARGIVSRLSVAAEVQRLCSLAVEKADKLMASKSTAAINFVEGSLPAACKFLFEEVTCSSVILLLIELSTASNKDIKGYKLWYCKKREEVYSKEPAFVFPRDQRRIWISNLQPCTEYSFRIISYTDAGDFGHSETKCFTKSVELIHKNQYSSAERPEVDASSHGESSSAKQNHRTEEIELDLGFKVRDLGRILKLAWLQHQGYLESFYGLHVNRCVNDRDIVNVETPQDRQPSVARQLDLNVASVPDLNEEFTPPLESSREEENGCTLGQAVEADDAISHGIHRKCGEVPADSKLVGCQNRRHSGNREAQDSDSTLTNGSPFQVQNDLCLDENFEYCVKIIRWLECEGHIKKDFRLKLLTWFSLRSTEQERRVLNTFIQTLIDDPSSLAGQLVDSFSDISSKRPQIGSCSVSC
ncbi:VIN3-like protein 1 isoform X2 [Salvia miltiorrhiza]|uniref:VIN3-like protein 1 isoform X2 n=1 Tax=Salvia miltiorrhiza TaxID=226208 RepID=UPI0025AD6D0A|nr:VIN3-like protein 1 isoform X2 [Salvia miltiorrhiza]XP_057807344.1 VIN3-like protein 1 isoform X2 [Salvia miltiorrhiza]